MFHEIRDNWFLLACVALFFVAWGISAWIKKMFRWDDFKRSALKYVIEHSRPVLGPDTQEIECLSRAEFSRCVNAIRFPVRDKIIQTGGWSPCEFGRHCILLYAKRSKSSELMDVYWSLRKAADEDYSPIWLP